MKVLRALPETARLQERTPYGFTWAEAIVGVREVANARTWTRRAEEERIAAHETRTPCNGCLGRAAATSREVREVGASVGRDIARDVIVDLCPRHASRLAELRHHRREVAEAARREREDAERAEELAQWRERRLRDPGAANRASVVYRLRGHDGTLLYIGVAYADGVLSRLGRHEKTKEWWTEVDTVAGVSWTAPYATRFEAEEAERVAIETEAPRYNVTYNRRSA